MPLDTDISVRAVDVSTETIQYRTPMKFGGRVVRDVSLLNVSLTVESRAGKVATGIGSMPLGNVWAWPSANLESSQTLQSMTEIGQSFAQNATSGDTTGHPLQISRSWHEGLINL